MAGRHAFLKNDAPYVNPDDGRVFEVRAKKAFAALLEKLGRDAYRFWWEVTFEVDGKTADNFTWRQICEAAERELNEQ